MKVERIAQPRQWGTRQLILLLCLGLAFGLRIYGLAFGLPYHFHPDEDQYVEVALRWYTEGILEPRLLNPPLFTYVLAAAYGWWVLFSPFEPSVEWVTTAYFFARWWSVAFGLLTVALMFPLGRLLGGAKTGLLAVILFTGLFLPAREAHFAVNDAPVTFFVALAIYFSLALLRRPTRSTYLAAGVAVGLATATKFTAGLVVLPLLVAHLFAWRQRGGRWHLSRASWQEHWDLLLGLLSSLLTFLIIAAFHIFWRLPQMLQVLSWHVEAGGESYKGTRMAPATGWQFYLDVFGWGLGWVMLAAILLMLGLVGRHRYRPGFILAIFPLALFAYMGSQKILFARYLLPAFPPLVALVALGLLWLVQRQPLLRARPRLIWPLLVGGLLFQPLANLVWFNYLLTLPDTRQLATAWFMANFPEDTLVAAERYSILPGTVVIDDLYPSPYELFPLNADGPTPQNDTGHYLSRKAEIIALSNFSSGRARQAPAEEEARLAQLAFWEREATLFKSFNPYRTSPAGWFYQDEIYGPAGETLSRLQPGPLIHIYQLPYEKQPYTTAVPEIEVPIEANFGNKVMLLGYRLHQNRAQPGESFALTLYWQALARMPENYVIFSRLLDEQQQRWGGFDRLPQETSKTSLWLPDEVVIDTFNLPVAAEAPDGVYTIDLGLYTQHDPLARPLPLVRDGQPLDQTSVRIGPVKVGGAPAGIQVSETAVMPQHPLQASLGEPPTIALQGYDLRPDESGLQLALYWKSLAQTPTNWSTFVHLRNASGETVAQKDGPAGGGLYPTSLWDPGEMIIDQLILPRPPQLEPGVYRLVVGLYQLETGQRLAIPGSADDSLILTTMEMGF